MKKKLSDIGGKEHNSLAVVTHANIKYTPNWLERLFGCKGYNKTFYPKVGVTYSIQGEQVFVDEEGNELHPWCDEHQILNQYLNKTNYVK